MNTENDLTRSAARKQAVEIPAELLDEIGGGYDICYPTICYTGCRDIGSVTVCRDYVVSEY